MQIFKEKRVSKDLKDSGCSDTHLIMALKEVEQGLVDAVLGGDLYKKRISLPGTGKRGGMRILIATRFEEKWFVLGCLKKSERENFSKVELDNIKYLARVFLELSQNQLTTFVEKGRLIKVEDANE